MDVGHPLGTIIWPDDTDLNEVGEGIKMTPLQRLKYVKLVITPFGVD
jgi:hypothetical protein